MTDAITIQNPRNRGGSTGHVLAKRSVTFTEIRSPRPRTFCRTRYRLSKQLPELILGLNHPKCKVTQSKALRNWAYTIRIEDPAGPYYVFFEISKAVQPGRQKQDLNLVVESAYHDDPNEPDPILLGDMAFMILCAKTYLRQPVATKR